MNWMENLFGIPYWRRPYALYALTYPARRTQIIGTDKDDFYKKKVVPMQSHLWIIWIGSKFLRHVKLKKL